MIWMGMLIIIVCLGIGSRNWPDPLRLSTEEGREWGGECECGEDLIYEDCGRVMIGCNTHSEGEV